MPAWISSDYTNTLLQRNEPGDLKKATSLLDESLAISSGLGMRPLIEQRAVPPGDSQNIATQRHLFSKTKSFSRHLMGACSTYTAHDWHFGNACRQVIIGVAILVATPYLFHPSTQLPN